MSDSHDQPEPDVAEQSGGDDRPPGGERPQHMRRADTANGESPPEDD